MFDHIVVLILENHNLNEIYGSSSAPYLTGLANAWSLSQGYSAVDRPSEPNYLALVSGLAGDCSNSSPNIGGCLSGGGDSTTDSGPTAPGGSYSSNAVNLVDRMEPVGLTWDAYYEGSSGGCDQSFSTAYHASLLFMNDIVSSSNRCSHIHSFSTSTPTNLLTELNGGGANLIWINPDNSHNMHDNSISSGDTYMSTLIPQILGSTEFTTTKAALLVTFDEGNNSYPSDYVYTILAGPAAKLAYKSTSLYDHYSLLATLEKNWGLTCIVSIDCNAPPLSIFLPTTPPPPLLTSFTVSPKAPLVNAPATFTATSSGGVSPYSISWNFGDGASGTGSSIVHTFTSAQTFTVTEKVTDSSSPSQTATSSSTVTVLGTPPPLSTGFTFLPTTPSTNSLVTFTAVTTGGTTPYTITWNFGDGSTGTGTIVSHPYTTAQSFTVAETVKDSSSLQQTATSSQTVTVVLPPTGNFGTCSNLPQGWSCGNAIPSASSSTIVNGVLETRQSNPGQGNDTIYYYATTQKGAFPWSPCQAPVSGVIPTGLSSVSANFTVLSYNPGSSPSSDRYHIYIALYYWLPNGPVSAGGSTYQCLDSQVRLENVGGIFSAIGATATYNPRDSFGCDQVTLPTSLGPSGTATGQNPSHAYSSAGTYTVTLTATDASSPQQKAVASKTVTVTIPALAASFTFTPSSPQVNSLITFTGSGAGGVTPYTYSWMFGDGQTASGATVTHAYSTAGSFTVTLTLTDAVNTQVISSQGITLAPVPMTASFTLSTSPTEVNVPVSFSATVTGGTPPYVSFSWNFGDGSAQGSGNTPTHAYTAAGTFNVTVTVTDSAGKAGTSSTQSVVVKAGLGVSTTTASPNPANTAQTVNFIATTSGGIAPVTCTWNFGDSASGTGCSTNHAYNTAGNFTAIVTVKDSLGVAISESIVVKITVAPQCTVSLAFSPATPEATSPVTFTATATNCSAPVSFVWAYGDGSAGTGITSTHIYSTSGTFSITVTATDSSSPPQIATSSRSMTVVAALTVPSALAGPNPNDAGVLGNFLASTNGGVGGVSGNWTFGDGASRTGCSTTHVYSNPGTFTVVVTAQDSLGVTASKTVSEVVNAQPTVSFTISPTSAISSQSVTITATTVGGTNPFNFSWNFGDNSSGSGNVVSHTYSVQGTYTVTLTVRDANAQTATSTQTLSVAPSPLTASFAMTPSSGLIVGQLASFTASVSGGTSPYTINWNFGDGTTASGNPVNHSFNMPGTYTVTVTVTDANGMIATIPAGILVNPLTLAVTISGPTTGTVGTAVTFTATGSGGTTPYTFAWTATGGSPASGTGASFSTTYSTERTFTVSVKITDANANTSIASQSVTAVALPITASFTVSTSPTIGVQVTFVASASGGTGGYSYAWNLGDDNTATGNPASHTYTTAGSFTVALTVTDSSMTQTTITQIITVSPSPPAPLSTSFTMNSASAQAGQPVTFLATTSGGTSPYLYSWSFGDSSASTGNPVSHSFTTGNYTITLTVTDSSVPNETAIAFQTITITTRPLTLVVPASQTVNEGSPLTFNVSATGDPSRTINLACDNCLAIRPTFTQNGGIGFASGNFSWTPSEGKGPGTYIMTISASVGALVVSANVSILVNEVIEQPVLIVPGPVHVRQGEYLRFMVNVTDPDWAADNMTLAASGLPDGASFDPSTGIFNWNISSVQPGLYTITFTLTTDGSTVFQDSKVLIIHVDNGNGRCFICEFFSTAGTVLRTSTVTTNPWLLLLSGMIGLTPTLAVGTRRAQAQLRRSRRLVRGYRKE